MLELVRRAVDGDRDAFCELVMQNWNRLVRLARSIAGPADAEDIVQEGLLKAWRKLGGLRDPAVFQSWIYRIITRKCLSFARRQAVFCCLESIPEIPFSPSPGMGIEVSRILALLPPKQRAVIHLTAVEGMTDSEIVATLGIRPGSVRTHRRRARDRLTRLLGGKL
jgi:RNA polymerase sigma-70 factor, ECF subfamily